MSSTSPRRLRSRATEDPVNWPRAAISNALNPVIVIGDCGTGKTHLLTGLCVAACRQKRRVRFATAAALVNELVEAKQQLQLRRVLTQWDRYDLIAIDEVGYVPMADLGAEFLFQVIAERAEKAAVIHNHQPSLFRMDPGDPQRPALQGSPRSHHRPSPHHRDRNRQLSLPKNHGERQEQTDRLIKSHSMGAGLPLAPARPHRISSTPQWPIKLLQVGQRSIPKMGQG